jgi:hypothetical protein
MTHITEGRVIGNHADMGPPAPRAARTSPTATETVRGGGRRRTRRNELVQAQSTWDSEGGATEREATADG